MQYGEDEEPKEVSDPLDSLQEQLVPEIDFAFPAPRLGRGRFCGHGLTTSGYQSLFEGERGLFCEQCLIVGDNSLEVDAQRMLHQWDGTVHSHSTDKPKLINAAWLI